METTAKRWLAWWPENSDESSRCLALSRARRRIIYEAFKRLQEPSLLTFPSQAWQCLRVLHIQGFARVMLRTLDLSLLNALLQLRRPIECSVQSPPPGLFFVFVPCAKGSDSPFHPSFIAASLVCPRDRPADPAVFTHAIGKIRVFEQKGCSPDRPKPPGPNLRNCQGTPMAEDQKDKEPSELCAKRIGNHSRGPETGRRRRAKLQILRLSQMPLRSVVDQANNTSPPTSGLSLPKPGSVS